MSNLAQNFIKVLIELGEDDNLDKVFIEPIHDMNCLIDIFSYQITAKNLKQEDSKIYFEYAYNKFILYYIDNNSEIANVFNKQDFESFISELLLKYPNTKFEDSIGMPFLCDDLIKYKNDKTAEIECRLKCWESVMKS